MNISLEIKNLGLLPRREEILYMVKDHPYISLDDISRRFPFIPKRTISYDVNQLVKKELLIKHGKTRGVCYSLRLNSVNLSPTRNEAGDIE